MKNKALAVAPVQQLAAYTSSPPATVAYFELGSHGMEIDNRDSIKDTQGDVNVNMRREVRRS